MKKIIPILLVVLSLIAFQQVNAQKLKFYYYPNNNVYYDVANRNYIYVDNGNWRTVRVLPSGLRVGNAPRYVVYNSTPKVWTNNTVHVTKYKNHPNGRAVGYNRNHYNKSNGKWHHNKGRH